MNLVALFRSHSYVATRRAEPSMWLTGFNGDHGEVRTNQAVIDSFVGVLRKTASRLLPSLQDIHCRRPANFPFSLSSPSLSLSLLWHLRSTTPAKLLPCGNCMPLFYYLGQNILISHLRTTFPTLSLLYSLTTLTNVPSLCFHLTSPSRPPWNRTPGLLR